MKFKNPIPPKRKTAPCQVHILTSIKSFGFTLPVKNQKSLEKEGCSFTGH
jgi:hypothetical protein